MTFHAMSDPPTSDPPAAGASRRPNRHRSVIAAAAVLSVIAALFAVLTGPASATPAGSPVAATTAGRVAGTTANGLEEFLGIPFAAPPVGALRWRPPVPVLPWAGTRDATAFGNQCVQPSFTSPSTVVGSEDCLYLNVYTPNGSSGAGLPVMFWIHGGAFFEGSGSGYDPSVIANREHVVVVTTNYRLGVFGFLALPSLDKESFDNSSGNYGLMDQQAALFWVRANIANFGGDPGRVTIFGESAGAGSVCDNLVSPTASGLFTGVIAESGCAISASTHAAATATGTTVANNAGCTTATTAASCLRGLSSSAVYNATGGESLGTGLTWNPNVSGIVMPQTTQTALAQGRFARVPLLQGSNHDEGRLFVALGVFGPVSTEAQYQADVTRVFGPLAPTILARYPASAYPSPALALSAVVTDGSFSCPDYAINPLASVSVPTYTYEFNDPNAPLIFPVPAPFPLGAYHGSEIAYVFGNIGSPGVPPGFTPAQQALSNTIQDYWGQFARTGNPNVTGAPPWAAFNTTTGGVQELTPTGIAPSSAFVSFHQCAFWDLVLSGH